MMPTEAAVTERRNLAGEIAAIGLETRAGKTWIVGLAAVFYDGTPATEFELWEGCRERIMETCFDRALAEKDDVRALVNHTPELILGRTSANTLDLWKNARGLAYRVDPPATSYAKNLISSLARGDISGSSFAFSAPGDGQLWRFEDGLVVRELRSVDLYDVCPCTYPAYKTSMSAVTDIGAGQGRAALRLWRASRGQNARLARLAIAVERYRDLQTKVKDTVRAQEEAGGDLRRRLVEGKAFVERMRPAEYVGKSLAAGLWMLPHVRRMRDHSEQLDFARLMAELYKDRSALSAFERGAADELTRRELKRPGMGIKSMKQWCERR